MNIIITGATGAMGTALARLLSDEGHALFLVGRDQQKLAGLTNSLGKQIKMHCCDGLDFAAAQHCVEQAAAELGSIDGLAHCVGSTLLKPLHLTSEADWRGQMEVNFGSAFNFLKPFVTQAVKNKTPASAVLVSSVVAHSGFPNHEAIAAAKAAVAALAVATAATYADKGIRVNVIAPGLTRSNMTARFTATPAAENRAASMNPMNRIGESDDLARLASFLLSPQAAWITGQIIGADGGQGVIHPLPKVSAGATA